MPTPATLQPCSAKTRIALLALWKTFGRSASDSQAVNAASSASSTSVGSNQAALPSGAASATSATEPVPSAQVSTVAIPRVWVLCSASQPASSPVPSTVPSSSTPSATTGAASASSAPGSTA